MNIRKSDKGFTIIEVVIVLAIAGLIFAIVFWALPNLQKNQRDNERRNLVGNLVANLDQYAANTNGSYPSDGDDYQEFIETFYDCTFSGAYTAGVNVTAEGCDIQDPLADILLTYSDSSGVGADSEQMTSDDSAYPIGTLQVHQAASCADGVGDINGEGTSTRAFATMIRLENGTSFCQDNS